MKNNRSIKRRGFTLVELLIVIVVIGVLSAMMMLSSTEAVTSARASNIVSNLRNLKTAALSLYASSLDQLKGTDAKKPTINSVKKYLNNEGNVDGYSVVCTNGTDGTNYDDGSSWYIAYHVTDDNVKPKLKARATTLSLKGNDSEAAPSDPYTSQAYVFMQVR